MFAAVVYPEALLTPCSVSPLPAYRICGWTTDEQLAWIAAPSGPAQFHDCIGIVVATYIRVERPVNAELERRLYSTYKKYHAVFFMVIVDRKGTSTTACSATLKPPCADLFAIFAVCLSRLHPMGRQRQLAEGWQ